MLAELRAHRVVEIGEVPGGIDIVDVESCIEQRVELSKIERDLAVLHGQADRIEIGAQTGLHHKALIYRVT